MTYEAPRPTNSKIQVTPVLRDAKFDFFSVALDGELTGRIYKADRGWIGAYLPVDLGTPNTHIETATAAEALAYIEAKIDGTFVPWYARHLDKLRELAAYSNLGFIDEDAGRENDDRMRALESDLNRRGVPYHLICASLEAHDIEPWIAPPVSEIF